MDGLGMEVLLASESLQRVVIRYFRTWKATMESSLKLQVDHSRIANWSSK